MLFVFLIWTIELNFNLYSVQWNVCNWMLWKLKKIIVLEIGLKDIIHLYLVSEICYDLNLNSNTFSMVICNDQINNEPFGPNQNKEPK